MMSKRPPSHAAVQSRGILLEKKGKVILNLSEAKFDDEDIQGPSML